jgi:hypothetical protein
LCFDTSSKNKNEKRVRKDDALEKTMKLGFIFNLINITYLLLSFLILTKSQLDLSTQTSTRAVNCSLAGLEGHGANSSSAANNGADCPPSSLAASTTSGLDEEDGDEHDEANHDDNEDEDENDDDEYDTFYEDNPKTNALTNTTNAADSNQKTVMQLKEKRIMSSGDLARLKRSLLYGYDRNSRPLKNATDVVRVRVGISIAQINNLDEVYQVTN